MITELTITSDPIEVSPPEDSSGAWGAIISFLGVVRGMENGEPIRGIRYSAYETMAEKMLHTIADEGNRRFPPHYLRLVHRTGFVATGEPSLVITVGTPHSVEGFEIMTWYLEAVKTRVPVWKEPVFIADAGAAAAGRGIGPNHLP